MPSMLARRRCGLCRSRTYRLGCPICELRQPSLFDPPPSPPSEEELNELRLLQEQREEEQRQRQLRLRDLAALPRPVIVGLVGCAKQKAPERSKARDLYRGRLFRLALDYSLCIADETFILSARHGLVTLDEELDPYDLSMYQLRQSERGDWTTRVVNSLDARLPDLELEVIGFAGRAYLDLLAVPFAEQGWRLHEPLRGLGVGARLSWLRRQVESVRRPVAVETAGDLRE